jgi:hypothetical protein
MAAMDPFIFDINTYVKADTLTTTLAGGPITIRPLVGIETDAAPFILYWWLPSIVSTDSYFINHDIFRYHILDTDAERGMRIQQAVRERLNKANTIQGSIASATGRILWISELRSGTGAFNAGLGAPKEREGFYTFQLNFEMGYVPLT